MSLYNTPDKSTDIINKLLQNRPTKIATHITDEKEKPKNYLNTKRECR